MAAALILLHGSDTPRENTRQVEWRLTQIIKMEQSEDSLKTENLSVKRRQKHQKRDSSKNEKKSFLHVKTRPKRGPLKHPPDCRLCKFGQDCRIPGHFHRIRRKGQPRPVPMHNAERRIAQKKVKEEKLMLCSEMLPRKCSGDHYHNKHQHMQSSEAQRVKEASKDQGETLSTKHLTEVRESQDTDLSVAFATRSDMDVKHTGTVTYHPYVAPTLERPIFSDSESETTEDELSIEPPSMLIPLDASELPETRPLSRSIPEQLPLLRELPENHLATELVIVRTKGEAPIGGSRFQRFLAKYVPGVHSYTSRMRSVDRVIPHEQYTQANRWRLGFFRRRRKEGGSLKTSYVSSTLGKDTLTEVDYFDSLGLVNAKRVEVFSFMVTALLKDKTLVRHRALTTTGDINGQYFGYINSIAIGLKYNGRPLSEEWLAQPVLYQNTLMYVYNQKLLLAAQAILCMPPTKYVPYFRGPGVSHSAPRDAPLNVLGPPQL